MVATSQPLAAQAGLDVLRRGGNALDAALATMAVMCVVEPCSTGIGGDAFALIWDQGNRRLHGINGSGPASKQFNADVLRGQGHTAMPTTGGATVTVPGSLRAWELAAARFGRWGLDSVLSYAIDYASNGFPVSPVIARQWALSEEKMTRLPDSARVWFPDGRAPQAGELFVNAEVAQTLRTIAKEGVDAFYTGDIAAQIVAAVQSDGGFLTEDDMVGYSAEFVAPIHTNYTNQHGVTYQFHEIPPNGQGLTALIALNIVDELDVWRYGWGTADYYHTCIEALKLAFADAAAYIADPLHAPVPVAGLVSDAYAVERGKLIGATAAEPTAGRPPQHGDTVYLTVADGDGNMVSWIQSLYMGFGSGITAGTTGVQLQNRAANFSLQIGHPNEAAPSKRPYHTIIPGFITRDNEAISSFGVMGGFMQPQGHLQVGLNLVEFGMSPQTALDAHRVQWRVGKTVALQAGIPAGVQGELSRRGHTIDPNSAKLHYGGGQVIVRDPESGVLSGGTEPYKDGIVAAY